MNPESRINMPTPCLFCHMPEARIVLRDALAYAVRDSFPVTPGHTLVIPKRHVVSFFDTTAEERAAMLALLDQAKRLLDEEFHPDAYNIGVNDGAAAGQTIAHLHWHLMPRYTGDAADPRGGVRWIIPGNAKYWKGDV